MSLLKILYFSHGWYLAEKARPLVSQPIEAWQHGPVIKVVKDAFEKFGKREINERARKLVLKTGELQVVGPDLGPEDASFVKSVFQAYKNHDAWTLSGMTHERHSPWDKVWNAGRTVGRLGLRIRNDDIRTHFLNVHRRFELQ